MGITTLAMAATAAFAGLGHAANMTEWKSRSIYQVMVDRFARTDGSTTVECELYDFCNGTWTGLINNLDYIQDMGFTAVQISPVVQNLEGNTAVGEAYHGYWSQDNYAINEHFGTADELQQLSDELHKRDMFLMVDVVINNMAAAFDNIVPPNITYSQFNPYNDEKYFHPYCNVTDWDNATDYQDCWLYPYGVALADLDTESSVVMEMAQTWIKGLVANYSIDGIRIDAAKHVDDGFLPPFVEAAGVFALGEVLTGVVDDMCRYQTKGLLQGMPNYLEYYPLTTVFNGGSMEKLAEMRAEAYGGCNDTLALGTFAENHDMPRFASAVSDMTLAKNAMTYVLLNDGIPTVYQGQEQHFNGSVTPDNREPLWKSSYNTSAPLYVLASTLNKVRNNAIKTSSDFALTRSSYLRSDVNHLCLRKGPLGSQVVFCINNKSSKGDSYEYSVGGFTAGDNVVEVLSCGTSTADAEGNVTMYMNKGEPKVYVLADALNGTGLCNTTQDAATAASGDGDSSGAGAVFTSSTSVLVAAVVGWAVLMMA